MSNVGRHTSLAQSNEHLSFVLMGELEQTRYMLRSLEASRLVTEKPEITLMAMEGSDNPQSLLQWDELSREVQSPVHIVKVRNPSHSKRNMERKRKYPMSVFLLFFFFF